MKLFTIQEANALLPTVRKVLVGIQRTHNKLATYRDDAKEAAEAGERGGGGIESGATYAGLLVGLNRLMGELEVLGVQLKDFERGLVDFPSMRDGRVILLCWQIGEGDEVEWWHDIDAGFAGRTPL